MEVTGSYNVGRGLSAKMEGFFMSSDLNQSHLQVEVMKEFSDSHISVKGGGGSYGVSMMQTLSPKLLAGFEM